MKSINTWSFYGEWTLAQKMELARAAGFEGFEPDISADGPITPESTDEEIRTVAQQARDAGVTLSALATGLYWDNNPVSDDPAVRERAAQILRAQIHAAQILGVDAILVVPGAVGVDFIPGAPIVPYDVAHARAADFIRQALPQAKECGVTIGIENVWNKFLLSPLEFRDFIDQFDSPHVGAYFDVGNALATGYPQHWIQILGSRIKRVHFKDYRRAVGTTDGFVDILSGDVEWPAVVQALRDTNYTGWITAEMIPPVPFYKHHPEVLIENTARAMEKILGME